MAGLQLEQPSATPTPCPLCRGAGQSAPQTTVTITRLTYFFGAQAVAQHITGDPDGDNNGLFYLLSDHLGSPVELADSAGTRRAEAARRYLPFGGYRQGSVALECLQSW